jgi:Ca2+-binding RTX toxin-like protein
MANINGTIGNDVLTGTGDADVIEGLGGSDTIRAGAGNDTLRGGDEYDLLYGDDGDDLLEGGAGGDVMVGGAGQDRLYGGEGNDFMDSQSDTGSDQLYGEGGDDGIYLSRFSLATEDMVTAFGGDGQDNIVVQFRGRNRAVIDGGAGDDVVRIASETATNVTLGAGRDTLDVGGNQLESAGIFVSDFEVGATGDRLELDEYLRYKLTNWDGVANPFATGHLRLIQSGADALLQIDRDASGLDYSYVTLITFRNVSAAALTAENLDGYPSDGSTPPGSHIVGTSANDTLVGSGGADLIEGLGGHDMASGGAGNDTLLGGDGFDRLTGDSGDDLIEGGAGRDTISGGTGHDRLFGGDDDDYIFDSDGGSDTLFGEAGNDVIEVNRFGGGSSLDLITVSGGDGDDAIRAQFYGSQSVVVDAGAGNDTVSIRANTETTITLGAGSDVLILDGDVDARMTFVITDFQGGPAGDRLDWDDYLGARLRYWDPNGNPFSSGHLRLVQSGADALLLFDRDGTGTSFSAHTLITFRNLDATTLTAWNLDGFASDGSIPSGVTLAGTSGFDRLEGTGGSDLIEGLGEQDFLYGAGGADTLLGGDGDDQLYGQLGDDVLDGGNGNDYLVGGSGSDDLYGGVGNDTFSDFRTTGSDRYFGEGGDDQFYITRDDDHPEASHISIDGGAGADRVYASLGSRDTIEIDLGDGEDYVTLTGSKPAVVTLGPGRDTYDLGYYWYQNPVATITDFEAGPTGDRLELSTFLSVSLVGWNSGTNPFLSGYLRLLERGGDTILELDPDGPAGANPVAMIVFRNISAHSLTAENLDGHDPFTARGTDGADTLPGTAGHDAIAGGGGADTLRLEQGGDDAASGGLGNDILFYGGALTPADRNDGGEGTDTLVLQGNYSLTLGSASLTAIEGVSLQSGSITRWGQSGANSYDYSLKTVDANVAAGQQLKVNAQSLLAGEDFTFDGSAETDGKFLIYAGHGIDTLTGGSGNDIFFFEAGRFGAGDKVVGGAGADAVVISGMPPGLSGSAIVTIASGALTSIESLSFNGRFASEPSAAPSYQVVLKDGNIAAGATLIVNASSLGSGQSLSFDASAEVTGRLRLLGGSGDDTFTGGANGDLLYAAGGAGHAPRRRRRRYLPVSGGIGFHALGLGQDPRFRSRPG